jgi:hypothetical protein
LERYLGVKIVSGEPQECLKDDQGNKKGDAGYKVVYEGGYVSWSPKETFENAYRKLDGLTFGLGLEAMKMGLKIRLPYWAEDVFLSIQSPDAHSKMTAPYIYVTSRFGLVPWVATQIEIFSEKWQVKE